MKTSNLLGKESSMYLQQHAGNPIAWQTWSDAAFSIAREKDVPVFVSVGYSTCHWCHVMAHETFEDLSVAEFLNEHYVCIKVDREERPDVDAICMDVCQATTGHGGWPLTIMMDAEKRPFFAGTYYPRYTQNGRLGFLALAKQISHVWTSERERVVSSAFAIIEALEKGALADHRGLIPSDVFDQVADYHLRLYDKEFSGFGNAPKFPSPQHLMLLLRMGVRSKQGELKDMVLSTLHAMRAGGIYDQVGFGFHRYSTDRQWLIPHFEKMLHDQAMHMMAYTEAWQCFHDDLCMQTVFELADYIQAEMTSDSGAFYSAQDADSGGREGSYYLFTEEELQAVHPDLAQTGTLGSMLGVTANGSYRDEATGDATGENVLHVVGNPIALHAHQDWEAIRLQLKELREQRPKPSTDNKILPDWNGLMIAALAKAARVFGNNNMLEMAQRAYDAVSPRKEYLDDHAMLAMAAIELYQTTGSVRYLRDAEVLAQDISRHFIHEGIVFQVSDAVKDVPVRPRQSYDGAYPCGNSIAALVFTQLGILLHSSEFEALGRLCVEQNANQVAAFPSGFCMLLTAWDMLHNGYLDLSISNDGTTMLLRSVLMNVHKTYVPWLVIRHAESIVNGYTICTAKECESPLRNLESVTNRLRKEVG